MLPLSFLGLLLAALYPVNDFLWHLNFEDATINADFLLLFVYLLRASSCLRVPLLPFRYLPGSRFRFNWLRGNVSAQCNDKTVARHHGFHELGIERPEQDRYRSLSGLIYLVAGFLDEILVLPFPDVGFALVIKDNSKGLTQGKLL